ncbi:sulfotransferase [Microcoleus sp. AT9_B5]
MLQKVHFISGLPRSGSTLLAAILRQNPRFHSAMTSPVGGLVDRMLEAMSEDNEFSVFISQEQKRTLIASIFSVYYSPQADKQVIFDTNRLWCSKLPLIQELFPGSKVICCVRNIAWIMDSIELLIRRNVFDVSRLFNSPQERATVYSRTYARTYTRTYARTYTRTYTRTYADTHQLLRLCLLSQQRYSRLQHLPSTHHCHWQSLERQLHRYGQPRQSQRWRW